MFSPTIYPIGGLVGVCACRCVSRSKASKKVVFGRFFVNAHDSTPYRLLPTQVLRQSFPCMADSCGQHI